MNLPNLDLDFFRNHGACYDPAVKLGENWMGTVLDILHNPGVPSEDKIWAISRKGAMPEYVQRLCAIAFVKNTPIGDGKKVFDLLDDDKSRNALIVAEKHARGLADDSELARAGAAAWSAARNANKDAALAAAMAADTVDVAWATAKGAAWSADWSADWDSDWAAAWDAPWDAQVQIAIHVINQELNQ